jgi:hypothetical protein
MILVLLISLALFGVLVYSKKDVFITKNSSNELILQKNSFCWYTFNDFNNPNNNQSKAAMMLNNTTNALIVFSMVGVMVSFALLFLSTI